MIITGCTWVRSNVIGVTHAFAAYDDSFLPGLKKWRLPKKVNGAPAILLIYHVGNKAIPVLIRNSDLVSVSLVEVGAMPFVEGDIISRPLTPGEILDVIIAFGKTATKYF